MKQVTEYRFLPARDARRKGAIAVELAIVLPLFAILLVGIFELGLMAQEHQILQNAAREGARFSGLPAQQISGSQNAAAALSTIKNRVIAYLANDGITVTAADITVNQAFPIVIGPLNVQASNVIVTYRRPVLFKGSTTFFGLGSVVLQGNAVFRNFY